MVGGRRNGDAILALPAGFSSVTFGKTGSPLGTDGLVHPRP